MVKNKENSPRQNPKSNDAPSSDDQSSGQSDQSSGQSDQSSGDQSDGDQSDGDQSDGDQSDGDQSDGDQSDGDQSDGDQSDGDQSASDNSNGDQSDQSASENSESGDDEGNQTLSESFEPDYSNVEQQFESTTQNNFDSQLSDMQAKIDYHIVNSPAKEMTMLNVIPIGDIMAEREKSPVYAQVMSNPEIINDYNKFKASSKKNIAILIKEFERKKSAFQYSRSKQSMTGSVDVNRLHSYKFEDQIFKSVTTLADAKNHGMVFFIDYSGSMRYTIEDVVEQTLQLVYFCKAVGIPFEVYGFTGVNDYDLASIKERETKNNMKLGLNINFQDTHIIELLNSSMKKDKFELAARQLKAQVYLLSANNGYFRIRNKYESMCSTPLYQTIIVAHDIVKRFKSKHNVQKMNTIFLTDGDGGGVRFDDNNGDKLYRKQIVTENGAPIYSSKYQAVIHGRPIVFNTYGTAPDLKRLYSDLIKNLKETCGTSVIGFFVANDKRDFNSTGVDSLRFNTNNKAEVTWTNAVDSFKNLVKKNKKEKCILVKGGFNYDAYFIFENTRSLNIVDDESFESDTLKEGKTYTDTSSQNKLAKDFAKFTSEKRTSRVFLNKFAEMIA
jgi:hypothetical protein